MSYLVGNPEDRFSCNVAHIVWSPFSASQFCYLLATMSVKIMVKYPKFPSVTSRKLRSFEPSHEIMMLFVLLKLILQTPMQTFHLLPYFMCANSERSGETVRMRRLAEPSLVAYAISTIIWWAGSFNVIISINFLRRMSVVIVSLNCAAL